MLNLRIEWKCFNVVSLFLKKNSSNAFIRRASDFSFLTIFISVKLEKCSGHFTRQKICSQRMSAEPQLNEMKLWRSWRTPRFNGKLPLYFRWNASWLVQWTSSNGEEATEQLQVRACSSYACIIIFWGLFVIHKHNLPYFEKHATKPHAKPTSCTSNAKLFEWLNEEMHSRKITLRVFPPLLIFRWGNELWKV